MLNEGSGGARCIENGGMTDRSVTLPPTPERRVPHRNYNTGEGGWVGALEAGAGQGHWESIQGGSGGSGSQGGTGDSGGQSETGD